MVEWKKLGEVCEIKTGKGITQKDCSDEYSYPVMSGGQSPMGMYFEYNREANTTTISRVGAYAGFVSFIKEKFYCNDKCFSVIPLKNDVFNSKFLYIVLKHKEESIKKLQSEGGVPTINTKKVGSIPIPIPSFAEQTRIVGILDTFTSSIENLKKQIAQRRKQYEYYRDQLLDLEGKPGVEMKKLNDCCFLISDGDHQPPPKSQMGVPFITISNIDKESHRIDFSNTYYVPQDYYDSLKDERKASMGDLLYTVTGSYGIPVHVDFTNKFCFQRHIALIRPNIKLILSRFLYHFLLTKKVKKQAEENASGGAQKTVSLNSLRRFEIYIPSLQEQQRIVSILDTFEASIANLEAQLEQREKQYEYYRNKLLTFEE